MTLREAAEKLAHEADNAWTLINTISNAASGTYPTDAGYGLANRLRAKAQALRAALAEEAERERQHREKWRVLNDGWWTNPEGSTCPKCGETHLHDHEGPILVAAAPCPAGEVKPWGWVIHDDHGNQTGFHKYDNESTARLHAEAMRLKDYALIPLYAAAPGKPEEGHSVVDATERTGPEEKTKGNQG